MALLLLLLLISINQSRSFFNNPPLRLDSITNRRNLTCASDFSAADPFTNCDYCVIEFFNNGTDSVTYRDCIYIANSYRLLTQRCSGFTNSSDIGYGLCSKLPFEYHDIDLLCICPTDLCNSNFTTCKQSVDANRNLPMIPSPVPVLSSQTSAIQCQDTPIGSLNSTYYCQRDSTPYADMNGCLDYVRNHTVMCMYTESDNGNFLTLVALPDEDYEYVLLDQINQMQKRQVQSNYKQFYNETEGSFYIYGEEILSNWDNFTMIYNKCFCKSANCNINLIACLRSISITNQLSKSKSY